MNVRHQMLVFILQLKPIMQFEDGTGWNPIQDVKRRRRWTQILLCCKILRAFSVLKFKYFPESQKSIIRDMWFSKIKTIFILKIIWLDDVRADRNNGNLVSYYFIWVNTRPQFFYSRIAVCMVDSIEE